VCPQKTYLASILAVLTGQSPGGRLLAAAVEAARMNRYAKREPSKRNRPKARLGIPDLDHSKSAVLDSLRSPESKTGYRHAIDEFIQWYPMGRQESDSPLGRGMAGPGCLCAGYAPSRLACQSQRHLPPDPSRRPRVDVASSGVQRPL
jgi:hypothetical protein